MSEEKEKKYRRIGWITSIGMQLAMLILFYFLIAWKEPFPPIPSYGIEVSFGYTEQAATAQNNNTSEEVSEEESEEAVEEEVLQQESTSEIDPEENLAESVETPIEPISETPSPDVIEQPIAEPKPEIVTTTEKEPVKPKVVEEKKKIAPETQMKPAEEKPKAKADETNTNSNSSEGTTQGEGKVGTEEGSLDARAIMGQQGNSKGASLQLAGWTWDSQPEPKDDSNESGEIVYEITVDADGYIKTIELKRSTVSPVVERYYRQSVERLSFSQTGNSPAASTSSGTLTFIIQSK